MEQNKNKIVVDIKEALPHRYPFLLVDKVLDMDLEEGTLIAQKCVSINEWFFLGHFPLKPIMPGVLIIEALAQAGGILIYQKKKCGGLLLTVDNAKFRNPVLPGSIMLLHVKEIHLGSKCVELKAHAVVDDKRVAEASIKYVLGMDTNG